MMGWEVVTRCQIIKWHPRYNLYDDFKSIMFGVIREWATKNVCIWWRIDMNFCHHLSTFSHISALSLSLLLMSVNVCFHAIKNKTWRKFSLSYTATTSAVAAAASKRKHSTWIYFFISAKTFASLFFVVWWKNNSSYFFNTPQSVWMKRFFLLANCLIFAGSFIEIK
jgi:hypothetical protein